MLSSIYFIIKIYEYNELIQNIIQTHLFWGSYLLD